MKIHLRDIVIGVLVLSILYLLFVHKPKATGDPSEVLAAKDKLIEVYKQERDQYRAEKDIAIAESKHKDSLLQQKSTQIQIRYEKIPEHINSLSKSDLRREFTNY